MNPNRKETSVAKKRKKTKKAKKAKRRTYDAAEKRMAVKEFKTYRREGMTAGASAEKVGISEFTLRRWQGERTFGSRAKAKPNGQTQTTIKMLVAFKRVVDAVHPLPREERRRVLDATAVFFTRP